MKNSRIYKLFYKEKSQIKPTKSLSKFIKMGDYKI